MRKKPKRSKGAFETFWHPIESILSSGPFYFFAGLALLFYAIRAETARHHPSLTFLIAILGVAILLYGTGSRAIGSIATAGARLPDPSEATAATPGQGTPDETNAPLQLAESTVSEAGKLAAAARDANALPDDAQKLSTLPQLLALSEASLSSAEKLKIALAKAPAAPTTKSGDWGPLKANAAVAGGAAVLAALFGWGVLYYKNDVPVVFGSYDKYVRIRIDACAAYKMQCGSNVEVSGKELDNFSFYEYEISASTISDTRIFSYTGAKTVQLIIFSRDVKDSSMITVRAKRRPPPSLAPGNEAIVAADSDIDLKIPVGALFNDLSEGVTFGYGADGQASTCSDDNCRILLVTGPERSNDDRSVFVNFTINILSEPTTTPVSKGNNQYS